MRGFKSYLEETKRPSQDRYLDSMKNKTFEKLIDLKSKDQTKTYHEFTPLIRSTLSKFYSNKHKNVSAGYIKSASNVDVALDNLGPNTKSIEKHKQAHDAIVDHLYHYSNEINKYEKAHMYNLKDNKLIKHMREHAAGKAKTDIGKSLGAGLLTLGALAAGKAMLEAYDPDLEDSRRENYQKIHALGDIARKREFGRWGKALHNLAKSGESEEALSARHVLKVAAYQSKLENGKLSVVHKAIVHHAYNHGTKGMSDEDKADIEKTYTHKMIKDHLKKFPKKGGEPKRRGPAIKKKDIKNWKKYIPYTPTKITGRTSKKVEESMNDIYMLMNSKAVLDYFPEEMGAGAIASGPVKGNTTDSVEIYDKPLGKKKKPDVVRRKPVDIMIK